MLHHYVQKFLDYSQIACFSERSLRTLTARLKEFNVFIKSKRLKSPKEIAYTHLIEFVSDFKLLFVHVKKLRVWAVKQSRGGSQNGPWNQVYAWPFPELIRVKRRRDLMT